MRQQWKTARERDRRRARYCIRQRVLSVGCSNSGDNDPEIGAWGEDADNFCNEGASYNLCSPIDRPKFLTTDEKTEIVGVLKKIVSGDRSFFSVSFLAAKFDLLSKPIPTEILLEHLPERYIVENFGSDHFLLLQQYLKSFSTKHLIEYTTLVGRYFILGSLLVGGFYPCLRGLRQGELTSSAEALERNIKMEHELQILSSKILRRFFDCFPLPLSGYITKRVIDMRLQSFLEGNMDSSQGHFMCTICQRNLPNDYRLLFSKGITSKSSSSYCTFCEPCFWKDILENIDSRMDHDDVVQCPCCGSCVTFSPDNSTKQDNNVYTNMTPKQRLQESKNRFDELPVDSKALKNIKRKRKKMTESVAIVKSWGKAVIPSLGLCQSVRQDKLFKFIDNGAVPYVKGCLEAGVAVDAVNEYGQSPLYLATWSGNRTLVEVLLEYGANPWETANGGVTLDGLCRANGNVDILETIQRFRTEHWETSDPVIEEEDPLPSLPDPLDMPLDPTVEVLIDPARDHPGAGSYLIHNCLPVVDSLVELWKRLPVDRSSHKTAKKVGKCADRSYFCDSEGWLRTSLKKRVIDAFRKHDNPACASLEEENVVVLPHVRFLHYEHAGSALAPHIDLCRVDQTTGQRSTHSFLLYLTSCETGGETVLLEDASEEGRNIVLSRVKPQLGHLLLFPHECPHEGAAVEDVPKLLIRGEVVLKFDG